MPPLTAKNIGFPGVSSPVRLRRGLDQSESVWFPEGLEPEKEILLSRLINMPVSATCGSSWRIRLQDQRRRRRYVAFWKFQLPDDIEHNLITHGKPCNRQAYCLAHQLTVDGDHRRLMIATLRYLDTFAKVDGAWLLAERRLYVDWNEERTLS